MPRPDNENQHRYGPYDYRTAAEDRQLDEADRQEKANKESWDYVLQESQSQQTEERQQAARREQERARKRKRQVAKAARKHRRTDDSKSADVKPSWFFGVVGFIVTFGAALGRDIEAAPAAAVAFVAALLAAYLWKLLIVLGVLSLAAVLIVQSNEEPSNTPSPPKQPPLVTRSSPVQNRFFRLAFSNQCDATISIAIRYRSQAETWVTRGWWIVDPGETITSDAYTQSRILYYYAESGGGDIVWGGQGMQGSVMAQVSVAGEFSFRSGKINWSTFGQKWVTMARLGIPDREFGVYTLTFPCD